MSDKILYSMGEVAEMFDVKAHVIRFWETKFDLLSPEKNKKGNRLFSPADVETLKLIYHLVRERGMTIEGARRALKQQHKTGELGRDAAMRERLQRIRSLLEQVRAELKDGTQEEEPPQALPAPSPAKERPVQVIERGSRVEKEEKPATTIPKHPRGSKDGEEKELFAYYEQSLF